MSNLVKRPSGTHDSRNPKRQKGALAEADDDDLDWVPAKVRKQRALERHMQRVQADAAGTSAAAEVSKRVAQRAARIGAQAGIKVEAEKLIPKEVAVTTRAMPERPKKSLLEEVIDLRRAAEDRQRAEDKARRERRERAATAADNFLDGLGGSGGDDDDDDDDGWASDDGDLYGGRGGGGVRGRGRVRALDNFGEAATVPPPDLTITTSWSTPRWVSERSEAENDALRKGAGVSVDGIFPAPPLTSFEHMKLPASLIRWLRSKGWLAPTPFQMQAIPSVLGGRDVLGMTGAGGGKTLCHVLASVIIAAEEESRLAAGPKEGPYAVIVIPSDVGASQTRDLCVEAIAALGKRVGPAGVNVRLCLEGIGTDLKGGSGTKGQHIVVSSPRSILDLLHADQLDLSLCRLLVLDDADKLVDTGFDREMKMVMERFRGFEHQTLVWTQAEFGRYVITPAMSWVRKPLIINVSDTVEAFSSRGVSIKCVSASENETEAACVGKALRRRKDLDTITVVVYVTAGGDPEPIRKRLAAIGLSVVTLTASLSLQKRVEAARSFNSGAASVLLTSDAVIRGVSLRPADLVVGCLPEEVRFVRPRTSKVADGGNLTFFLYEEDDARVRAAVDDLVSEAEASVVTGTASSDVTSVTSAVAAATTTHTT